MDYNLPAGTLHFDPCEATKYINVGIADDGSNEDPDETIEITLSNPSNAKLGTTAQYVFTILPPILYPERCPAGDLDGDCTVDANDLRIFASQWLALPGDPWPGAADGDGKSLTRRVLSDYGNDVVNWDANEPSPGLL